MKKVEAEKKAAKINADRRNIYCPIARRFCMTRCEFYESAEVVERKIRRITDSGPGREWWNDKDTVWPERNFKFSIIQYTHEHEVRGGYCDYKTECNCGD